jgi:hypothetical protein
VILMPIGRFRRFITAACLSLLLGSVEQSSAAERALTGGEIAQVLTNNTVTGQTDKGH